MGATRRSTTFGRRIQEVLCANHNRRRNPSRVDWCCGSVGARMGAERFGGCCAVPSWLKISTLLLGLSDVVWRAFVGVGGATLERPRLRACVRGDERLG